MRNLSIILILFITLLCSACGVSETKAFRSTSDFYYTHINTPAELEIKEIKISNHEENLISNLLPLDLALTKFSKDFSKYNYVPSPAEIQDLLRAYPWLTGLALTNAEGDIISQEPSYSMKNLDFTLIAEQTPMLGERNAFATVLDSELGAEIAITMPLYKDATLIGYFVAHFDPKSLALLSPYPENLVLLSVDRLLWAGNTSISQDNQAELFKRTQNSISGKSNKNQTNFNWLTIYIEDLPLTVGNISN